MPTAPKALEAFGAMQRNLAEALMETVASQVTVEWKEFHLDARTGPAGTAPIWKLHVIPVYGPAIAVAPPGSLTLLISEFWQVRQIFSPPWHGLKITITSAGECKVEFSYEDNGKETQN